MMELLLRHKAAIDLYMKNGRTALLDAAKYEGSGTAELLLKHKAEIDLQQVKVMCAWVCGNKKLVWWLISWSLGSGLRLAANASDCGSGVGL